MTVTWSWRIIKERETVLNLSFNLFWTYLPHLLSSLMLFHQYLLHHRSKCPSLLYWGLWRSSLSFRTKHFYKNKTLVSIACSPPSLGLYMSFPLHKGVLVPIPLLGLNPIHCCDFQEDISDIFPGVMKSEGIYSINPPWSNYVADQYISSLTWFISSCWRSENCLHRAQSAVAKWLMSIYYEYVSVWVSLCHHLHFLSHL